MLSLFADIYSNFAFQPTVDNPYYTGWNIRHLDVLALYYLRLKSTVVKNELIPVGCMIKCL